MAKDIQTYATEISGLFTTQLRVKGASLEQQVYKSGRRLPKRIKRDADMVAKAAMLSENPKLARQVDETRTAKAAIRVITHLKSINPRDVFWNRIILFAAKIAAFAIIAFVIAVWVATSQGWV